jgi:hypothetical protein
VPGTSITECVPLSIHPDGVRRKLLLRMWPRVTIPTVLLVSIFYESILKLSIQPNASLQISLLLVNEELSFSHEGFRYPPFGNKLHASSH